MNVVVVVELAKQKVVNSEIELPERETKDELIH